MERRRCRVRVTHEMINVVTVLLIDCGNTIEVKIQTILAPNQSLTGFCHPSYGIHCKLEEDVTLHSSKWKHVIVGEWIRVKIGRCDNGVHSVEFTSGGCNRNIVAKIRNAVLGQKATENGKLTYDLLKMYLT